MMELTKKDAAVLIVVGVYLLACSVDGEDRVLVIGKEVINCPGPTLLMSVKGPKITYSKKGTVSHIRATLHVEKDSVGKNFTMTVYRNAVVKQIIYSTTFDDMCKEVERTDNIYLNLAFRSGDIPRTCRFKKGKYPFHVYVNNTLNLPMAPPMLMREVHINADMYGMDDKPLFCGTVRAFINILPKKAPL